MAEIRFRCQNCGKKVSAPRQAGGKMGKCPYCQQRCYIPTPPEDIDEIPVTQVDPDEERKARELKRQALAVEEELTKHEAPKGPPAHHAEATKGEDQAAGERQGETEAEGDLAAMVQQYIINMVKGDLGAAEALTRKISRRKKAALEVIDDLAMTGFLHPDLADVPPNVVSGFFRQLRKAVLGGESEGE